MSNFRLAARSPLTGLGLPGSAGTSSANPAVVIAERTGLALANVAARRHAMEPLVRRVREAFDIELPGEPRRRGSGRIAFAWAGPSHWLVIEEGSTGHALVARLRTELSDLVSVSDQTHGRVIIRIRGRSARSVLAKGLPIDLHNRSFQPGYAAVSVIGHIGIHLWQIDDEPTYELAVPASYARSFWSWIAGAAAEYEAVVESESDPGTAE